MRHEANQNLSERNGLVAQIEALLVGARSQDSLRHNPNALVAVTFQLYYAFLVANVHEWGICDGKRVLEPAVAKNKLGIEYTLQGFMDGVVGIKSSGFMIPVLDAELLACLYPSIDAVKGLFEMAEKGREILREDGNHCASSAVWTVLNEFVPRWIGGRLHAEHATVLSTAELLNEIVEPAGKAVRDFACGYGAALSSAAKDGAEQICGSDINGYAVMQAKMNCFFANPTGRCASGSHQTVKIKDDDLLDFSVIEPSSADVVMVTPPLGMKLRSMEEAQAHAYRSRVKSELDWDVRAPKTVEEACIVRAMLELNGDGVAVVHAAPGLLFREANAEKGLRNNLMRSGSLYAVVELPSGTSAGTSINMCLLIFGRKKRFDDVLLVNMAAESLGKKGYFDTSRGPRSQGVTKAGIAWLKGVLSPRVEIPGISKLITVQDFEEHGGTLKFAPYGMGVENGTDNLPDRDEVLKEISRHDDQLKSIEKSINSVLMKL